MLGRMDEFRTRYEFECAFKDLRTDCHGRILSLIVFNNKGESYFETLTIKIEKPKSEIIRIVSE